MTIRLSKLGGTDFGEEGLKPTTDLVPTLNAIVDADGFILFDATDITHTGVSTLKRTYTINKAVDGIEVSGIFYNNSTSENGLFTFKKNGIEISDVYFTSVTFALNTSESIRTSGNSIQSDTLNGKAPTTLILNESFAIGDTLELWITTGAAGGGCFDRVIKGYKNKTSDTEWITVS